MTPRSTRELAEHCAPNTPATTLVSVVRVESGFSPWAIRVNGPVPTMLRPASREEATRTAEVLIGAGRNVDLGLAQINSRNLALLGLSVEGAFEPCSNLAAAASILNQAYVHAWDRAGADRSLLHAAYSIYNSGDAERGIANGYASKVEAAGRVGGD